MSYFSRRPMAKRRRSASAGFLNLNKLPLPKVAASDRWLVILMVVFVTLALVTAILTIIVLSNKLPDLIENRPSAPVAPQKNSNSIIPLTSEYTRSLKKQNDPDAQTWDGKNRVTVLVMGLDARDAETGEASRTDSMILFSMDPATGTAGMLSIPRDLWVNIPGYGEDKLNTAYFKGEADKLPGGGPGMAVKTVQEFIGIPINYFAQIDFNSFVKMIDEIGGVDIKVREPLVIDPIGPNNTIFLKPGTQTFMGAEALAYARARDTARGDFDRAKRQQEVIMAVRDNVLNYYSLPKLVLKAPALYNDIASGVRTNMSLTDGIRMAWYVQQINIQNIRRGVIQEPDQATADINYQGQYVLLPDAVQIQALRDEVFSTTSVEIVPTVEPLAQVVNEEAPAAPTEPEATTTPPVQEQPTPQPTEPLDPKEAAKAEKANVIVLNGTNTVGLAARTHEYLMLKGIKVIKEDSADNKIDFTEIRVSADKPNTVPYLANLLKVSNNRIFNQDPDPANPADIVVILGSDWSDKNPMP